jgi:hypothetical protein
MKNKERRRDSNTKQKNGRHKIYKKKKSKVKEERKKTMKQNMRNGYDRRKKTAEIIQKVK